MANAYVTLDTVKGTAALNIAGTAYDTRLLHLIENISRQIDRECNRTFYFYTEVKYFDGDSTDKMFIPDLISLGTLREDNNEDGTFDTIWASTDIILLPYNAQPTADWGHPYDCILVNPNSNGSQDEFLLATKNYEITGTWGFRNVVEDSGRNGTLADGTATSLVLDGTAANLEVGQTIAIGSEQVYVTALSGTAATVERAKNGSTGTAHTNIDVKVVQYPGEIQEAVLIQMSRLWKRKDSGFASEIGMPQTGEISVWRGGLDPDVKELISPYRRLVVG